MVTSNGRPHHRSQGPELIGQVIDQRFRVVSLIGSGGMADVYEVEHVALGRRLALKVLRHTATSNPTLARRFSREARALSRIASEHVVSIFDYGILPNGFPFFVMDLLRGRTLRAVLDAEHVLTIERASNLAVDVCLGLTAAHQTGLVHRDLKPENLWLTRRDDGREACILLDFGVARDEHAHTTSEGVLVGTARYMSPEQIRSGEVPGPESDVFAVAVVLYECLCGVAPFSADSLERTLFRVLNEEPRPLSELAAGVPPQLSEVLTRALEKERRERFQSALELARALLPFAGPFRQLQAAQLGAYSAAASNTLEDDAATPPLVTEGKRASMTPALVGRPLSWSRAVFALSVFLVGVASGALLLRKPSSGAAVPRLAPDGATVATANPAPLVLTAAASSEPSSALAVSSAPVTKAALRRPPRAAKVSDPPASAAAHGTELPPRSDPPQPSFDGRNPYRP